MGITAKLIATCALLAGASGAFAQVKCTMPNGKTITLQSAPRCPADATKAETIDGKPLPKPSQTPEGLQVLEQQRLGKEAIEKKQMDRDMAAMDARLEEWKAEAKAKKAAEAASQMSAVDAAYAICKMARTAPSVTQCDVEVNFLSNNNISLVQTSTPNIAQANCRDLSSAARKLSREYSDGRWEVLIYSPFSGKRPIARCAI